MLAWLEKLLKHIYYGLCQMTTRLLSLTQRWQIVHWQKLSWETMAVNSHSPLCSFSPVSGLLARGQSPLQQKSNTHAGFQASWLTTVVPRRVKTPLSQSSFRIIFCGGRTTQPHWHTSLEWRLIVFATKSFEQCYSGTWNSCLHYNWMYSKLQLDFRNFSRMTLQVFGIFLQRM